MNDNIAIKVEGVYKNFRLPHEKVNSIKSLFTGLSKKRTKSFEVQHALKDISFEVKRGEFFGIVGRNGSGKSTLLKIIAEIYRPTRGKLYKSGKLVPFIELGVGFNPELTGRENVYLNGALLGFSQKEVDALYDDIVEFAELEAFMDQKLKNYSSGMQVRLAFSVATRAQADILLIDEVLAVGDAAFQRKCFEYFKQLKKNKKTVIFVSHDMGAVKEFCDRALLINDSVVEACDVPSKIADRYARLFVDNNEKSQVLDSRRWGSGVVKYEEVSAKSSGEYIEIEAVVSAKADMKDILFGMHINASDGREIVATNNRMIQQPDIQTIKQGEKVFINWKILNIFNDGKFYVDVTLADAISEVFDWYCDAATFTIKRTDRSTTPIMPPITVNMRHH